MSDRSLFRSVNDLARHTGWLHGAATAWTTYGLAAFALLLLGGYLVARTHDDLRVTTTALLGPAAVLVAVAANQPLVHLFHRARPFDVLPGVLVLTRHASDSGFPSDHAVMAGATAVAVLMVSRRLGAAAVVAALAMAFARVYIGVHFPGDVVVGLAVGAVVAYAALRVGAALLTPVVLRLSQGRLRPLVLAA